MLTRWRTLRKRTEFVTTPWSFLGELYGPEIERQLNQPPSLLLGEPSMPEVPPVHIPDREPWEPFPLYSDGS